MKTSGRHLQIKVSSKTVNWIFTSHPVRCQYYYSSAALLDNVVKFKVETDNFLPIAFLSVKEIVIITILGCHLLAASW